MLSYIIVAIIIILVLTIITRITKTILRYYLSYGLAKLPIIPLENTSQQDIKLPFQLINYCFLSVRNRQTFLFHTSNTVCWLQFWLSTYHLTIYLFILLFIFPFIQHIKHWLLGTTLTIISATILATFSFPYLPFNFTLQIFTNCYLITCNNYLSLPTYKR